jgi:hypothetical protein
MLIRGKRRCKVRDLVCRNWSLGVVILARPCPDIVDWFLADNLAIDCIVILVCDMLFWLLVVA